MGGALRPGARRVSLGSVDALCEASGNSVRPWAEAGYDCVCYDIQHSIRRDRVDRVGLGTITYRWFDVRSMTLRDLSPNRRFVVAGPPCTGLAGSGARDWDRKGLRGLIDALEMVEACRKLCEDSGVPYWMESSVGRLSTIWRMPDYYFHPHEYAGYLPADYRNPDKPAWVGPEVENYTKKTCLWVGDGFVMPEPKPYPAPHRDDIHKMAPSEDRGDLRSATPMGFSRANYLANAPQEIGERCVA